MILNKQVFHKDPTSYFLPNDGVAKVVTPQTPEEWDVARYEVEQFVCKGSYSEGMRRILESYLTNLSQPTQKAVWVHGFYGCGKSQLVRMLEFLWRDLRFPDGRTARDMAHLSSDVRDALTELSSAGRQRGGLWSAAGTLSAGSSSDPRSAILGVVLRSAGLPERVSQAQFDIWLRRQGWLDQVQAGLATHGRKYSDELQHLYVSTALAQELSKLDQGLGASPQQVLEQIRSQFPSNVTVTTDLMVQIMREVFQLACEVQGKLPCVLVVMDELQQYLGDSVEKADVVQEAVEAAVSRFGSSVLFVATGQSALVANPVLQKLQGRFTIHVALEDRDAEQVLRQTVLLKRPSAEPELKSLLEVSRGEIDRHLGGTQIGPESGDAGFLTADYPLLPTRRRFWQKVLRGLDQSGTAARLRTQLRLALEAAKYVGDEPIGHIVGGDFVFDQQRPTLLQTAALSRATDESISDAGDDSEDGKLKSRICALLYLIGSVHETVGLKPTVDTIADLLVTDLSVGSASLRQKVPTLVSELVARGIVMQVGEEYRLQTPEGAEWNRDYRSRTGSIKGDDARIGAERHRVVTEAIQKAFKTSLSQGESKSPRQAEFCFGAEVPTVGAKVPIWVQTGWDTREAAVKRDALSAGSVSPVVFVFLPRVSNDLLRLEIAGYLAAKEVLDTRPKPETPDGEAAMANVRAHRDAHERAVQGIVDEVLANAKVSQGGGTEVPGADLKTVLEKACQDSLLRLYSRFPEADLASWNRVSDKARRGDPDPLGAVGYSGDASQHSVCREVLAYVGISGKQGNDVRRHFESPPYGWPRDAADAAMLALTAAGHLRSTYRNQPAKLSDLTGTAIQQAEFRAEQRTLTLEERTEIRRLLQDLGVPCRPGEEASAVSQLLDRMRALAEAAGGSPPLPEKPQSGYIDDLESLAGNERLAAVFQARARLRSDYRMWTGAQDKIRQRMPKWELLIALLEQAADLPVHEETTLDIDALLKHRILLTEPNPLPPLLSTVAGALRIALREARDRHLVAYDERITVLLENEDWKRLSADKQHEIRERRGLGPVSPLTLDTDENLLHQLQKTPLGAWEDKTAAVAERITLALLDAARAARPAAERFILKPATICSEEELDQYLHEVRVGALKIIGEGRPVVLP